MHLRSRGAASFAMIVACVTLASGIPSRAAETAASPEGWQFEIVPYIWGSGLSGDVKLGLFPAQGIEASFEDILDHLTIAGMAAFEARKGRWGMLVDAFYIDLEQSAPASDPDFGTVDASMNQQMYGGLLTYRIYQGGKTSVDLGGGTRYYRIDSDLTLVGGVAQGRGASGVEDWWDWLAAVRVVGRPSARWTLMALADVGAGGSHLTWEGIATANFAFNKTVSLAFGYRYLDIDYDQNDFLYDAVMQGPVVGVGFHF